jgi:hypothetical protein
MSASQLCDQRLNIWSRLRRIREPRSYLLYLFQLIYFLLIEQTRRFHPTLFLHQGIYHVKKHHEFIITQSSIKPLSKQILPWSRDIFRKLLVAQVFKKFHFFYGNRMFTTTFARIQYCTHFKATKLHSITPPYIHLKSLLSVNLTDPTQSKKTVQVLIIIFVFLFMSISKDLFPSPRSYEIFCNIYKMKGCWFSVQPPDLSVTALLVFVTVCLIHFLSFFSCLENVSSICSLRTQHLFCRETQLKMENLESY